LANDRRWLVRGLVGLGLAGLVLGGVSTWVWWQGRRLIRTVENVEPAQAILVLGAGVHPDGRPSDMLADRLEVAYQLYRDGRAPRLLLSGDHGRKDYDEVRVMRDYLVRKGVSPEVIFLDHAGFDTYDSFYRAKAIFQVESVIVVTQAFHLARAAWIGDRLGLKVQGVTADLHHWPSERAYAVREVAARLKAFGEVAVGQSPRFLGEPIPITGDGRVTHE
jgi:SanA protein